jgi:hypothetical protein
MTIRELQLRQELNNIQQKMLVANYTSKIKEIDDAMGSIDIIVEEDEMVPRHQRCGCERGEILML